MFTTLCRNCKADVDPVLDEQNDTIVCPDCYKELENMSPFIKVQLRAYKQVKKPKKQQTAYSILCKKCNATVKPVVKNGQFLCSACGAVMNNISDTFKNLILENSKQS